MQFGPLLPVAGLDPATHVSVNQFAGEMKDVDGRAKPGHSDAGSYQAGFGPARL